MTRAAFSEAQELVASMESTTAQANVEAARARLTQAQATLAQITTEIPANLNEVIGGIQAVNARITELGAEKNLLEATGTHPTEENMILELEENINTLFDMRERLTVVLEILKGGITPESDAAAEVGVAEMEVRTAE